MVQPLYKHLEEMAHDEPAPEAVVLQLRPRAVVQAPAVSPSAERLGEAYARGYEEGHAAGRSGAESALAALRAECEERLAETKGRFAQAVAAELALTLARRLDELQDTIETLTVSALLPVLGHVLEEAAVRELAAGLRALARDGAAVSIELGGPQDLIERVWRRFMELGGDAVAAPAVKLRPSETTELRVEVDGTLLESRLNEWAARIAEAVR